MHVLKLILLIITFPIWFPVLTVVSAVIFVFSLVVSLTGFAVTALAAALSIAGIIAFVLFIVTLESSVPSAIMGIGGGCILLGLGLMVGTAGINLCIKLFPWLIDLMKRIFTKPFHRSPRIYTREIQVANDNADNSLEEI